MSLCANNVVSNNVSSPSVLNNYVISDNIDQIKLISNKILFVFSLVNVNTQVVQIDVDNYCNFYDMFGSIVSANELSIVHTFFTRGGKSIHCTRNLVVDVSDYNYVVYLTN